MLPCPFQFQTLSNMSLDSFMRTKSQSVDYIIKEVEALQGVDASEDKARLRNKIWVAYCEQCDCALRLLTEDEFIEEMDSSVGWDWVFKED